jgi:hypothetical protein
MAQHPPPPGRLYGVGHEVGVVVVWAADRAGDLYRHRRYDCHPGDLSLMRRRQATDQARGSAKGSAGPPNGSEICGRGPGTRPAG